MRQHLKEFENYEEVFIQTFEGHFINEAAFNLYFGCKNLNKKIITFEEAEIPSLKLKSNHSSVVVGSVNVMHLFFNMIGVNIPKPLDIPDELEEFAGRYIYKMTLAELIDKNKFPIFVKPGHRGKLFNGNISLSKEDLELYQHYDEELGLNMPIIGSEVVNFVSEYRCFVYKNELVDIRRYKGKPTLFPDVNIIKKAIEKFKEKAPVAYVLDFGVEAKEIAGTYSKQRTLLVEANDFYATGTYGLDSFNHTLMFLHRYKQITQP